MAGTPNLPPHWKTNPAGGVRQYQKAEARLWSQLKSVRDWLLETWEQLPVRRVEINALHVNETYYEYLISTEELQRIVAELKRRLGEEVDEEYFWSQVNTAYQQGTGAAVANLAAISSDYTRDITQVLTSQSYQRRVALLRARIFEEMQGFEGETGKDLARVLSNAVEVGESPLETAKTIRERFDVSRSRAERIARTEITGALRQGRIDEDRDANEISGVRTRLLWLSALSPTTRASHAARHGNLYSAQECKEFWNTGANQINCKCATVSVAVDDEGNPLTPGVIERVRRAK